MDYYTVSKELQITLKMLSIVMQSNKVKQEDLNLVTAELDNCIAVLQSDEVQMAGYVTLQELNNIYITTLNRINEIYHFLLIAAKHYSIYIWINEINPDLLKCNLFDSIHQAAA